MTKVKYTIAQRKILPTGANGIKTIEEIIYDANGNLTNGGGRTVTWNAANYPVAISQANHATAFTYGPDRQRVTQTETTGGTFISATVSIGALFEQTTDAANNITYRHFIRAGSQTIAIHTRTSDYTQTTTYLHRDHLGSISAITDEDGDILTAPDGTVIGYYSYDAWGNRRNPETWQGSATNPAPNETDRGYTGHKMLDGVGLIHMGGRVYDPALGRFFSADPIIQAPYNSQSYNRYSYVWNNPLSNTDPSGFIRMKYDAIIWMDPASPWFNTTSFCVYGEGGCTEDADRERKGLPPLGEDVVLLDVGESEVLLSVEEANEDTASRPNYIIIYGVQGSSDDSVYTQTVTIVNADGEIIGKYNGSSTPNPYLPRAPNIKGDDAYPYVKGGVYTVQHGLHKGEPALIVNHDAAVPTTSPNPRHPKQGATAIGIHVHKGSTLYWKGSAGCFTIRPDQWSDFISTVPDGDGFIYVPPLGGRQ